MSRRPGLPLEFPKSLQRRSRADYYGQRTELHPLAHPSFTIQTDKCLVNGTCGQGKFVLANLFGKINDSGFFRSTANQRVADRTNLPWACGPPAVTAHPNAAGVRLLPLVLPPQVLVREPRPATTGGLAKALRLPALRPPPSCPPVRIEAPPRRDRRQHRQQKFAQIGDHHRQRYRIQGVLAQECLPLIFLPGVVDKLVTQSKGHALGYGGAPTFKGGRDRPRQHRPIEVRVFRQYPEIEEILHPAVQHAERTSAPPVFPRQRCSGDKRVSSAQAYRSK